MKFILIVALYFNGYSNLEIVDGFASRLDCERAATQVRTLAANHAAAIEAVCIETTKGEK